MATARERGGSVTLEWYDHDAPPVEMGAQAQPVTPPGQITRRGSTPIQEPHVAFIIETSGPMSAYEYALGPIDDEFPDGEHA